MARTLDSSPYLDFDRETWRELRKSMPQVLTETEVEKLRGLGDRIDLDEVADVYLPLSRLIHMQVMARQQLTTATESFLGNPPTHVPFVIGVAGSVAVGKSTTARLLQVLLQRWESHPKVALVTTDGFLFPTETLKKRGLMQRKGFPESYDRRALLRFVTDVKSGKPFVKAPLYSHITYDIVDGEYQEVHQPDILILEGLNVLQTSPTLTVADLFDFSVYVDARTDDIEQWYIDRFLTLRHTAFREPNAHFSAFADMNDEEARAQAREIWQSINLPNLVENILPTRVRASLVLKKGSHHLVEQVRMRKLYSLFAKAARTLGIIPQGAKEVHLAECWPVSIREPDFGVRGLPQEKARQALFTRGTDHQIRVRKSLGIQVLPNGFCGDAVRHLRCGSSLLCFRTHQVLHGVHNFLAPAIAHRHIDDDTRIVLGFRRRRHHALANIIRE